MTPLMVRADHPHGRNNARARRRLATVVACAICGVVLVTASAQARTPKPRLYELHQCLAGYPCEEIPMEVFTSSRTWQFDLEGYEPGTFYNHKVGHKTYTVFELSDIGYLRYEGIKDKAGYSSPGHPGTALFRTEFTEISGTFWMTKR